MKITEVRCVPVLVPRRRAYGGVVKTALGAAAFSDYTIVFVDTDAGITGLGEVDSVFKRRGALLRHDLEKGLVPAVIGEDPFRISRLVRKMDDALDGVEEAKAAIEMALWDIVGKALHTPVYNLLGGKVRDRIPLSYSIPFGAPDDMAGLAQERAATLEYAVDLAQAGDAGVGVDEHDRVIGECRRAERRFDDSTIGAAARNENGNTANFGDLHVRAVRLTMLID